MGELTSAQFRELEKFTFTGDSKCAFCDGVVIGYTQAHGSDGICEHYIECRDCHAEPYDCTTDEHNVTYWQWQLHPDEIPTIRKELQQDAIDAMNGGSQ